MSHSQEVRIYRVYGKPCKSDPPCIQIYVTDQENYRYNIDDRQQFYLSDRRLLKPQKTREECQMTGVDYFGDLTYCRGEHWTGVCQDAPFRPGDRFIVPHILHVGKLFHSYDMPRVRQVKISPLSEWNAFKKDYYAAILHAKVESEKLQVVIEELEANLAKQRHRLNSAYPDIEKRIAKCFL